MTRNNDDAMKKMDAARDEALSKLVLLYQGMTKEQRIGADLLFDWMKDNYRFAGFKRLGRVMNSLSEDKSALFKEEGEIVKKDQD